ncbi:hypothetical protein EVAR_32980_1 [Eumeta japonica]|uniref:Uncharacterized protein n=1 Tax=Eumeta variegata TaxID=151549 RepID=A0A4C1VTU7_EUMVA|nr:hypothetical protein EVAR_32980_1 [Eumeta japonica]
MPKSPQQNAIRQSYGNNQNIEVRGLDHHDGLLLSIGVQDRPRLGNVNGPARSEVSALRSQLLKNNFANNTLRRGACVRVFTAAIRTKQAVRIETSLKSRES